MPATIKKLRQLAKALIAEHHDALLDRLELRITMGDHATNKLMVERSQTGSLLTSKLVGATVYDNKKDTIGKVEDLVIVQGKAVSGVIVSVGGFLGMGDSYVLVNPSSFAVSVQDGTVKAYLNATKEQLKNAPKYTYKKG